jgi:hypothetical protein
MLSIESTAKIVPGLTLVRHSTPCRRKEGKRNVEQCKSGSNVSNHAWKSNRRIDFENGEAVIVRTISLFAQGTLTIFFPENIKPIYH